ncbi:hypothetical protein [Rhodococcus pyridinivorans]|nr:hypothetical protein [Rhodococcus pyridinivorans]
MGTDAPIRTRVPMDFAPHSVLSHDPETGSFDAINDALASLAQR